jgi:hypothetical protein
VLRAAGLWLVVAAVVGLAALVLLYRPAPEEKPEAEPEHSVIQAEERDNPTVTFATKALTTWGDREASYDAWWKALRPMLTAGARQAYVGTDPAKLPDLGTPRATDMVKGVAGTTLTLYFKTEAGRFGVDMSRAGKGEPWQVHRIVFPRQDSVFE